MLDLYARTWQGTPLDADEYVISSEEKTSNQARCPPAYDVHAAKASGRWEKTTGIDPFMVLVTQVLTREPYAGAKRVFRDVDYGSSHRGKKAADRLPAAFPNAVLIHSTPRCTLPA
ncbi:hypothetical protein [Streptomyces sclerotialus]|uniref:hypothetical protein n=1 Tax=Streptomyces sclerotialus TaxID=1957 RepID=UPI000AD08081